MFETAVVNSHILKPLGRENQQPAKKLDNVKRWETQIGCGLGKAADAVTL